MNSFYLKSDPSISGGEINLPIIPPNYELTIFPVNGRALPVSQNVVNWQDKTVTFDNLIRYDIKNNRVLGRDTATNTWTVIPNYFSSDYTGTKIYQNNLYSSAKADILNPGQFDLSKPWKYMMYGPSGDVSMVMSITFQNNIYTFTSDTGKVEFDNKGIPIRAYYFDSAAVEAALVSLASATAAVAAARTVIEKLVASVSLTAAQTAYVVALAYPTADTNPFKFVVYKYNGFSQMTSSYLGDLYDKLKPESGCEVTRNNFKYVDFYSPTCKIDVASLLKIYIYGQNVGSTSGGQLVVNKIIKSIDDPGWKLLFYTTDGKGIAFNLDGTPLFTHTTSGAGSFGTISYDSYLIYRKDGFTNFTPTNITRILPIDIAITITRDITYQRTNPTFDNFQIIIPNDKPTNRIFVYQSGNNKLVHITNYIPKGTTQNVTINYSHVITSSITPFNPLPVPNFNVLQGTEDTIASDDSLFSRIKKTYEDSSLSFTETSSCGKTWIYNQNDITCPKGQILSNDASRCVNIYSENTTPIKSITYDVTNGTEPVLYSNNNGTSVNCGQGVITRYMRRGWGYTTASIRGTRCSGPNRYYNRYYKTRCALPSIE